jgi:hypothetical protein
MLVIQDWAVDREFRDYVRRLVGARLLSSTDLYDEVLRSDHLSRLVHRPLFARMLTFVGVGRGETITSPTALYRQYIEKLAETCDNALRAAGCVGLPKSIETWRTSSWLAFEHHLIFDEQVDVSSVKALAENTANQPGHCYDRSLGYILDFTEHAGRFWGEYIHYSFYEFLVASHVAACLEESLGSDQDVANQVVTLFKYDLPRRIRHFLTALLPRSQSVLDSLASAYESTSVRELEISLRRTACNLIVYVMSRVSSESQHALWRLVAHEADPFLRDSLMWAICHCGDPAGALAYISELDQTHDRRCMNRGYLLYYHGDLPRTASPPYFDNPTRELWEFTRAEVLEMMSEGGYLGDVPASRRAIDLYTFFDFAISRGHQLSLAESEGPRRALEAIWLDNNLAVEVRVRLLNQASLVLAPS